MQIRELDYIEAVRVMRGTTARIVFRHILPNVVPNVLVLSTFALDGPTHCSGLEVARYDASGLANEFGPAFSLIGSDREEHRTPWNAVQPFTWVTLRRMPH